MTDTQELTEDEAAYWYRTFEASDALSRLFDTADVAVAANELERQTVRTGGGLVTVKLCHEAREGDYVLVRGRFDADSGELLDAEIDDAYIAAPLAGHGRVWRYEDDEITEIPWMS